MPVDAHSEAERALPPELPSLTLPTLHTGRRDGAPGHGSTGLSLALPFLGMLLAPLSPTPPDLLGAEQKDTLCERRVGSSLGE